MTFQTYWTIGNVKCLAVAWLLILHSSAAAVVWDDISRLNQQNVQRVVVVASESDVIRTLRDLTPGSNVVISATRHSQGGHIVYANAVVLDMTKFDRVIAISKSNKTITVQSGATWKTVQEEANRHNLSVKIMQSSNIFSVGGSLSANIHGRDPGYGPLIESIKSLKIALASGEVVATSRKEMSDLFYAVIGGYGLVGVILEAEIELTDNVRLLKKTTQVDYKEYANALTSELDKMALHYGRCSFVKDQTFLRECYSTNFYVADPAPVVSTLADESNIKSNSLLFNFSRNSDIGKSLRWELQKKILDVPAEEVLIDRNNAMRPPVKFLEYESLNDTDILQEYFVPVNIFAEFMDELRSELLKEEVNLLSITLRYLQKNEESILSYSNENMIAIVLYINIDLSDQSILKAKSWTRNLVASVLRLKGTYYLTYQRFPTLNQFRRAYPKWRRFREVKCKYDPNQIFDSSFYSEYFREISGKAMSPNQGAGCAPS